MGLLGAIKSVGSSVKGAVKTGVSVVNKVAPVAEFAADAMGMGSTYDAISGAARSGASVVRGAYNQANALSGGLLKGSGSAGRPRGYDSAGLARAREMLRNATPEQRANFGRNIAAPLHNTLSRSRMVQNGASFHSLSNSHRGPQQKQGGIIGFLLSLLGL